MDYNLPGSSVQGILQARILEWAAITFSRDQIWVSCITGRFFTKADQAKNTECVSVINKHGAGLSLVIPYSLYGIADPMIATRFGVSLVLLPLSGMIHYGTTFWEVFIISIFSSSVCAESDHQSPEDLRSVVGLGATAVLLCSLVFSALYLYILINVADQP